MVVPHAVGHVPRKIPRATFCFLKHGGGFVGKLGMKNTFSFRFEQMDWK